MADITSEDLEGAVPSKDKPVYGDDSVPEEVQLAIKNLANSLEIEDRDLRESALINWRRNEDYWNGIQDGFYSALAKRYISGSSSGVAYPGNIIDDEDEVDEYDSTVNIYRAHGESIIAALSTGLPFVRFFPKNADDPDDISTSKAASKISEMIQKQNKAQWIFLHALYLLYTSPFVAARTYRHESKEYGTTQQPVAGEQTVYNKDSICQKCGTPTGPTETSDQPFDESITSLPQVPPEGPIGPEYMESQPMCPTCGPTAVSVEYFQEDVPAILGYQEIPKTRECIEVYGALNIKVAHKVKDFDHSPYLIFEDEVHYTWLRGRYPKMADQIDSWISSEAMQRQGLSADSKGVCTYTECYIRPWAYNFYLTSDPEVFEYLKAKFPEGLKICYSNNLILAVLPVNIDEEWTLTKSPLQRRIHQRALGDVVVPLQDMRNDLVYMTLDTVKHGVGDTFANPDVLDFNQYSKFKNEPGSVYPAKPRRGESLSDSFVSIKSATLSQEVREFWAQLDQDAQFVLGDFPSVYGGNQQGGSRTLGEYVESQSRALQRLSTPWKMLSMWWSSVMSKCVNSYIKHAMSDEYYVKSNGDSYENIWIRAAELQGRIGEVEPDISEQFPVTWSQRHAMFLEFIKENPIEPILATMFHPENTNAVAEILGLSNLFIPGQSDRNKQLREIADLLKGQPTGMMPSVMPDMDVDNHEVHVEAIKAWAVSESGMEAKTNNPMGYANVILHLRTHEQMMMPVATGPADTNKANIEEGGEAPPPEEGF
jgi:hypothetical protein